MIDLRYPINFEKDLSTRNFRTISGHFGLLAEKCRKLCRVIHIPPCTSTVGSKFVKSCCTICIGSVFIN